MGGGKGPIDHYVTPVKAGRVIIEMGGKCEFVEVSHLYNSCLLIQYFIYMIVTYLCVFNIRRLSRK
jgi:large subunit ribosomal protein L16